MSTRVPDPIATVAALDEPTRRRLYDFVVAQRRPVGRDEASSALEIGRPTVAFHLDRLVAEGLLDVVHERLSGRTGPGAGRPAKLYLRSEREVEVSLPGRRYDLAGMLLADAVEQAERSDVSVREALGARAREAGREIGRAGPADDLVGSLRDHGFEPRIDDGVVHLGNCPFHQLAQAHTELVCGMNLDLIRGVLDGLQCSSYTASLQPSPGDCCVVLEPS